MRYIESSKNGKPFRIPKLESSAKLPPAALVR
jgi:hypothetical protein